MKLIICSLDKAIWLAVRQIYSEGIQGGHATFETDVPGWDEWDRGHLLIGRIAALIGDEVVGWAALSPFSGRSVYGGVADVSVYISKSYQGQGIGKTMLDELITRSEEAGLWTLQAGIFPENKASIALHRNCGFREVGYREKIGKLRGKWRDVILMERRSIIVD
jgi:phosphinothricin acetyltransferase